MFTGPGLASIRLGGSQMENFFFAFLDVSDHLEAKIKNKYLSAEWKIPLIYLFFCTPSLTDILILLTL